MMQRILAMIIKEVQQMLRDRLTVGMVFIIPVFQLMIFGYAINGDPRHLPVAIEYNDHSVFTRAIDAALANSSYFDTVYSVTRPGEGEVLLREGKVQFVISIPVDFSRDLVRGQRAQLLVTADASDPSATGNAIAAVGRIVQQGLSHDLIGALAVQERDKSPVEVILHRSYNPEGITSHNIVPGLLAIILSITMVMMTAMAVTRENEQGTMENLLAMPLRPFEVMVGKIAPYMLIGLVQTIVILFSAWFFFAVPFEGSVIILVIETLLFAAVSLSLGFTFSTIAQTQLQAMQMSFFYMFPSFLLSGFLFPFRGMPTWAQWIGELLPATHFMRIARGIMLKGWDVSQTLGEAAVLCVMLLVLGTVAVLRYRDTVG